ncbi:MAG: Hpt domain-containing protein, partial [Pseudomonadota bacterium]
MSQSSSIRDTFFEECQDLLEALDEGLNQINDGQRDPEVINAVFRAVHSIKGGAGAFGLSDLVGFAHTFETVFDEVRSQKLEIDAELIKVLFRAADHLVELVEAARDGEDSDEDVRNQILTELEGFLGEGAGDDNVDFEPMSLDIGFDAPISVPSDRTLEIHFKPYASLYRNGHEPLFLFRALAELGQLSVVLSTDELAAWSVYSPNEPCLSWVAQLTTDKSDGAVQEVFDFVEGLCDLSIGEAGPLPVTDANSFADSQDELADASLQSPSIEEAEEPSTAPSADVEPAKDTK